jgi:hypothetical protein
MPAGCSLISARSSKRYSCVGKKPRDLLPNVHIMTKLSPLSRKALRWLGGLLALFVRRFPECNDACHKLAARFAPEPSR